jgi:DNA polymerase-3 subunit beta
MKFSCTQENLKRGLMITGYVAGKNLNLPILNNVLLKIDENTIQMISTNLEVAVRCQVRGKIEEPGEFTVPSKLFLEYVNLLPDDRVDLDLKDLALSVVCKKHSTRIKGLSASEFPLIPSVDRKTVLYLTASALRKALQQVIFAVSNVESRPELTGVLFNVNPSFAPGKLVLAATDSYRLSEKTLPLVNDKDHASTGSSMQVVVPGRTLAEVTRILSLSKEGELETGVVEVIFGDNQAVFRFVDIELISRVIDARYPDYRPIIPEKWATETTVKKTDVIQAVKGASLFSKAGLCDVHFSAVPGEGLVVSSTEGQSGKNESAIEAEIDGPKNQVTLNYKYFLDGVGAADGTSVRIRLIDATNPCMIVPTETDRDEKFLYIVMPIKQ